MEIFVGNLSFSSTEDDIRGLFSVFGTVERVNIITDRESGRSRGFCFVAMPNEDEARDAIQALNGVEAHGRIPKHQSGPPTPAPSKPSRLVGHVSQASGCLIISQGC